MVGQLRHQPDALEVAPVRIVDVLRVRIEGRQGTDRSEQHPHRVRVVPEALEELLDVRVDVRVVADVLLPPVELLGVRELAFEQEECRLEERRLLRELLDRIPPVAQDPRVAVDVRDRAAAGRRVEVRRVVGHQTGVVVLGADLLEVGRPDRPVGDGQRVLVPGAVVGDRQRVLRHRSSPFLESTLRIVPDRGASAAAPRFPSHDAHDRNSSGKILSPFSVQISVSDQLFTFHPLTDRCPNLYSRTRKGTRSMLNTFMPTTSLAEAVDAAAGQLVRHTPAGFPFRSGYGKALVERQMR